jgi:hypothetical protein
MCSFHPKNGSKKGVFDQKIAGSGTTGAIKISDPQIKPA